MPVAPAVYTVGGTVSGLAGSVTLANNGGDSRSVSANGAFTFATSLANAAAYSVTVTAQPANQTCTVGAGTGTVSGANVTTVAISCDRSPAAPAINQQPMSQAVQAPAAVAFSAVIDAGYPAAGLQWQVSADAGATWNDIAGATQPNYTTPPTTAADDGKRFRIVATNASGSVTSNAAVLSVTAAPPPAGKAWSAPLQISNGLGQAEDVRLAGNAHGDLIAVWAQLDPVTFGRDIWSAHFTAAQGWSAAEILDSASGATFSPDVAMDAAGNALAVWTQEEGTGLRVWGKHFAVNGGWSPAQIIETDTLGATMTSARVVMDASGNGLAIWRVTESFPQTGGSVRAARYAGGWQAAATLTSAPFGIESAGIQSNAAGFAMVAWAAIETDVPLRVDVHAASCDIGAGGCGADQVLESDTTGGWDAGVTVAVNAAGDAVAAWGRYDLATSMNRLRANVFHGGAWSATPAELDSQGNRVGPNPAVALDAAGNAVVVTTQTIGVHPDDHIAAFANAFDVTSGWAAPVRLESQARVDDIFPTFRPQVGFTSGGDVIAVYETGTALISSAVRTAGAWALDRDIEMTTNGVSRSPQLAFDDSGAGIAVFIASTGFNSMPNVFVSRYE